MFVPVLAGLGALALMSNPRRKRRRAKRRNPGAGSDWMSNAGLAREFIGRFDKLSQAQKDAFRKHIRSTLDPDHHAPHFESALTGKDVAALAAEISRGRRKASELFDRLFDLVPGRLDNPRRRNPPASPLDDLALKAETKTLGFSDILPFVQRASMVDLYVNYLYVERFAERLPQFNLFIGDDEISYENHGTPKVRILRRSDLENTKNGAVYKTVLVSEQYGLSKRGEKKLAAALVARVAGLIPWYNTSSMASWRFTKSNPRRRAKRGRR